MSDRWLRCVIRKGMFSDEKTVVIRILSGEDASFFVPREWVQGVEDHEGQVKVRAFHDNSLAWAVVPDETQSIVAVDESQFVTS